MTTQSTTRRTLVVAHLASACLALVTLATFWSATIFSELTLSASGVAYVKRGIALGLCVLVPAIAATGATGARIGGDRRGALIDKKRRRMRLIALNGLIVLAPAAIVLCWLSRDGVLGPTFYALQGLELIVGAINVSLLALNFRDGFRLSRSRRRASLALAERGVAERAV
jgi:F0F1-type ATP synthase membrane subunit c/vacuolar-type H+-ATPase subunit K